MTKREFLYKIKICNFFSLCFVCIAVITSALHAEGRGFDSHTEYFAPGIQVVTLNKKIFIFLKNANFAIRFDRSLHEQGKETQCLFLGFPTKWQSIGDGWRR
jgi:hypothetical protein